MIVRKPQINERFIIKQAYMEQNPLICEAFPIIQPREDFTVLETQELEGHWGITKVKHTNTGEILDVLESELLTEIWALFIATDEIKMMI